MENKFSKMMFALVTAVMLSVSSVYATWVNVQVTPGSCASEISWTLSDASGAIVASTNAGYYTSSGISVDYWVNVNDVLLIFVLYILGSYCPSSPERKNSPTKVPFLGAFPYN